jgi:Tol biopolymer transport system component
VYLKDRHSDSLQSASDVPNGALANGASGGSTVTPDGRFVLFNSDASNLVANDTNGAGDVFLRDFTAGTLERVDLGAGGAQASGGGSAAGMGHRAISDDGRFVVFSASSSLLSGGMGTTDVYVRDRQAGTTARVSVSTGGTAGNGPSTEATISADGRYVAFTSEATNLVSGDTNGESDVFVRDRETNTTTRVSVATGGGQGDSFSDVPSISADGRYVAFTSFAGNLVSGDTNSHADIFVRDRTGATTTRVSISSSSAQANDASLNSVISRNGRYVLFTSSATNLVSGDTNGVDDEFVRDRTGATTTRVSVSASGAQSNDQSGTPASISDDGRWAGFDSAASNLVAGDTNNNSDVFVRDTKTPTTTRESLSTEANIGTFNRAAISKDGRFIAFESGATNLVPGDDNGVDDIFVRDVLNNTTEIVSVPNGGGESNGNSSQPSISDDGRYVAFTSDATNLVPGDTNNASDVFVRDRVAGTTIRVSNDFSGNQGNGNSFEPSIAGDGGIVAYASDATNLTPGDTNGVTDVFETFASGGSAGTGTQLVSYGLSGMTVIPGNGPSTNPSITPGLNGGTFYVAFQSDASNLVSGDTNGTTDIFRWQFAHTPPTIGITLSGNGPSTQPAISADGMSIAYQSNATNLVAGDTNGDTDIFATGISGSILTTARLSVANGGAQGNNNSTAPSISGDGRFVAFSSLANNLVPNDTNAVSDVFLRDRTKSFTSRVSTEMFLGENPLQSDQARLSGDGRYVVFRTPGAISPAGDDFNHVSDEYLRAAIVPTLASISAASGARGSTHTYTFTGTYYFSGMHVNAGSGITVNSVNVVDEQHLSVNMTIASSATAGSRRILAELPGTGPGLTDGSAGSCTCFSVT